MSRWVWGGPTQVQAGAPAQFTLILQFSQSLEVAGVRATPKMEAMLGPRVALAQRVSLMALQMLAGAAARRLLAAVVVVGNHALVVQLALAQPFQV